MMWLEPQPLQRAARAQGAAGCTPVATSALEGRTRMGMFWVRCQASAAEAEAGGGGGG
jgi:hypothetical protein